jgi:hypothetical protein
MKYEIRLAGADQDDGKIDLQRLILIAQSILEIAKGALQLRLLGVSSERGRTSERITAALKVSLANLKHGSTILELECDPFKKTLDGQQGDAFRPEILGDLPDQTPMSLVMQSFREALNYEEDSNHLDKSLLKKLKNIEKIFVGQDETLTISNQGRTPNLQLKKIDFKKIRLLEASIPEPQEVIINGVVEELKYSKLRVIINTQEGPVSGIISENLNPDEISKYWGKDLTISGTAHYQPSGKLSFLYINRVFEPHDADKYFSRASIKETAEQQIQRQQKNLKYSNKLGEIVGQWPGDEQIEDILNELD